MFFGVTDVQILFMIIFLKKDNVFGSTNGQVFLLKKGYVAPCLGVEEKQNCALEEKQYIVLNNIDVFVLQKGGDMGWWRT